MTDPPVESQLTPIAEDIFCPKCGYNLCASTAPRCTECGYDLAGLRATESAIPWLTKQKRDPFYRFWKTVWFVIAHHRQFCEELVRPIPYKKARNFQWMLVVQVWLCCVALVVEMTIEFARNQSREVADASAPPSLWELAVTDIWPAVLLVICLLLWLLGITGVQSYFFHPKSLPAKRQNTLIALSYFSCAPLALTCFPIVGAFLALLIMHESGAVLLDWIQYYENVFLGWLVILFALLVMTWIYVMRTARRTMPQLPRRTWALAYSLPLLWLALSGLTLVALPAVVIYVLVVFASFS